MVTIWYKKYFQYQVAENLRITSEKHFSLLAKPEIFPLSRSCFNFTVHNSIEYFHFVLFLFSFSLIWKRMRKNLERKGKLRKKVWLCKRVFRETWWRQRRNRRCRKKDGWLCFQGKIRFCVRYKKSTRWMHVVFETHVQTRWQCWWGSSNACYSSGKRVSSSQSHFIFSLSSLTLMSCTFCLSCCYTCM